MSDINRKQLIPLESNQPMELGEGIGSSSKSKYERLYHLKD